MGKIPAWVEGKMVPVDKIEVHRRGLRHPAVSVFVVRGREVLIQRRALGKYHTPGLWANTCCTHPHWGEDALDCAHRRLGQELGIDGLNLMARGRIEYRADVGKGMVEHELVDLFVAEAPAALDVTPNPQEVDQVRWIDHDALIGEIAARPGDFTPWMRIYMADHAGAIFGPGG